MNILTKRDGNGMGYHRLLTHRAYQTQKWIEYMLAVCGSLALQGGPLFWVSTHRLHHQSADSAGDPHSPHDGLWWSHAGWLVRNGASLRAALVREQAEHTVLLKCRLRLVEGGARESESVRSFADGLLIHVNLAEHLVLDLQQVVGIEEIAVLKQRVSNRFGLRIERAMPAEGLALLLTVGWRGHAPDYL